MKTEFVASSRRLEDCDWVEERASEEAEEMLSTLVEVLGRVVLVRERLEEIVVFATKAQDGRTHFLDLPGIRISALDEEPLVSILHTPLSSHCDAAERLKSKQWPHMSASDITEQNSKLYQLHLNVAPV